jgi:hypothetical protein
VDPGNRGRGILREKDMRQILKDYRLVLLELALLAVMIGVLAIDEFACIPLVFAGIPWDQYKLAEFAIEASLISVVGLISVLVTLVLQRRLRHAESFLRVCGWCRKVSADDAWIPFEEYIAMKYHELPTHGICEACKTRLLEEAKGRRAKSSAPVG